MVIVDYISIESGDDSTDVYKINAKTIEDAQNQAGEILSSYFDEFDVTCGIDNFGDFPVTNVSIIKVESHHKFDLKKWFEETKKEAIELKKQNAKKEEAERAARQRDQDLKDIERLKQKLGK